MTKKNKRNSQASLLHGGQTMPSTSSEKKHDDLIKELLPELLTSELFRNALADLITLCLENSLEKLQKQFSDLSDRIHELEDLSTQNQKALYDLRTTVRELEFSPKDEHLSKVNKDSDLFLRIHGLDAQPSDFCDNFCNIVSSKLRINCYSDQLTVHSIAMPAEESIPSESCATRELSAKKGGTI